MVLAMVLLGRGRPRRWAFGLGGIGAATVAVALWLVTAQTVRERQGEGVTVTRTRYAPGTRTLALVSLIGLPSLGLLVALGIWTANRRRRRGLVPRYLKAGRKHLLHRDYDTALASFNQAIESAPYRAEAYYGRGCVYQAMGQTEPALADFDQAVQ